MRQNVGGCDRFMRLVVGFALLLLGLLLFGGLRGEVWGLVVATAGVLALATGLSGFCPLYVPFGISTARADDWKHGMLEICGSGPGWAKGMSGCCGSRSGGPGSGAGVTCPP